MLKYYGSVDTADMDITLYRFDQKSIVEPPRQAGGCTGSGTSATSSRKHAIMHERQEHDDAQCTTIIRYS